MNKVFLLIIAFIISSCSLLLKQAYDEDKNRINLLPQKPPKLYCEAQEATAELVGPSLKNQEFFWQFLQSPTNEKFESSERFVLWVLLNFNLRPDKVSAFAGVRLFESNGENLDYREYRQGTTPLLFALNDLLKRQGSKLDALKLAKYISKNYQRPLYVDEDFESFLETNKKYLWEITELRDILFKDNQTLKNGETLPLYPDFFNLKISPTQYPAVHENLSSKKSTFCDHSTAIYNQLPHKIIPIPENFPKPLVLGFKQGSRLYFMAIEQELKFEANNTGPFHTRAIIPDTLAPFCYFPGKASQLLLIAYDQRDPGQFLNNLSKKIIQPITHKSEIANLLSEPRQLVLFHPTRILIEADNTRLSQKKDFTLEKLFQEEYPVFQSEKLAQINALLIKSSNQETGFIADKRSPPIIRCQVKLKEKSR